ncbi:MAG: glycosyltransferase family 4 protein [FCB group bacterium]|nr:glycosyltransferase family 4 protein [FCB group bacterium]
MKKTNYKILMVSSIHHWNDPRIFFKETMSLAKYYSVSLMAVARRQYFMVQDIPVTGLPFPNTILVRIYSQFRILFTGLKDYSIVHIHDPELLWIGFVLMFCGKKVVYDMHENVAWVLKRKGRLFGFIGTFLHCLEKGAVRWFAGFIIAEKSYAQQFIKREKLCLVRNFTLINPKPKSGMNISPFTILYTGKLSLIRGTVDLIQAVRMVRKKGYDVKLTLVGTTRDSVLYAQLDSWKKQFPWLEWTGWLPFDQMEPWIIDATIGVTPLHSEPNYRWSFPTKIFDYMNWGLPYLYSDLPINRRFFNQDKGGIEFQSGNIGDLAEKIIYLIKHPQLLKKLAEKSRKNVHQFSWESEEKKLIQLYKSILS